jgi:hypothetical protein
MVVAARHGVLDNPWLPVVAVFVVFGVFGVAGAGSIAARGIREATSIRAITARASAAFMVLYATAVVLLGLAVFVVDPLLFGVTLVALAMGTIAVVSALVCVRRVTLASAACATAMALGSVALWSVARIFASGAAMERPLIIAAELHLGLVLLMLGGDALAAVLDLRRAASRR